MKDPDVRVIRIYCISCGEPMDVVAGSAPDREAKCNLCVIREVTG